MDLTILTDSTFFQQYLFIYFMVMEILIVDQLISKTSETMDFIKEYDDLVQRKRIEYAKRSLKEAKNNTWNDLKY